MEIISPGQKIRKIRKELKINQKEITGGEIARELISMIENDKSTLTPAVAHIITDNINRICKEKNIDFSVDTEYLLEDIDSQTDKIASKYIDFLSINEDNISKDFSKDIEEIELFLIKYDVPKKKMIIYEKIGDIFKKQKEYNKSYIYYIKAFENHNGLFNDIRLFSILQKLGGICIYLGKDKEALDFNNLALTYNTSITEELRYNVLHNNTLAYMHLEEYNKALLEIEYIENTFKTLTKEDIFELNVLKANCFRYKKFYSDALKTNELMLSTLGNDDTENIILITANILDIYTVLKDIKNIKIYIDKLIYLLNDYSEVKESYHSPNTYNQLALSANLINNIKLSIEYYKKSIEVARYQRNKRVLLISLDELLDILIKEKNIEEINSFKNQIIEMISLDIIKPGIAPIFKLMVFYNDIGDNESLNSLLQFILDSKKD
jgi:tetratricopeptide (TPR) repeat protein